MSLLLNACILGLAHTYGTNVHVMASKQEKLTNKHLVIAAIPWPPYIEMSINQDGEVEAKGYLWDYINFVLSARNCTHTLMISPYKQLGYCPMPNNCTGLTGMVNRNEVDFAIG